MTTEMIDRKQQWQSKRKGDRRNGTDASICKYARNAEDNKGKGDVKGNDHQHCQARYLMMTIILKVKRIK